MIRPIRIAILAILILPRVGKGDERSKWLEERWRIVESAKADNGDKSMEQLGSLVRGLVRQKDDLTPEARELHDTALKALLGIPSHADYFGNQIKRMADNDIAQTGLSFPGRREWNFQTLSLLPSPQTVSVLGELLFDERDPGAETPNVPDDSPWAPNCLLSVEALHALGIKNPPVRSKFSDPRKDLRTWQLWFEQVRAGTRTFSFEGDDRIFSLSGPVSEAREPGSAATQPIPETSPASMPPESSKWPMVIAAVLAFASLLLAALRTLKPRRS